MTREREGFWLTWHSKQDIQFHINQIDGLKGKVSGDLIYWEKLRDDLEMGDIAYIRNQDEPMGVVAKAIVTNSRYRSNRDFKQYIELRVESIRLDCYSGMLPNLMLRAALPPRLDEDKDSKFIPEYILVALNELWDLTENKHSLKGYVEWLWGSKSADLNGWLKRYQETVDLLVKIKTNKSLLDEQALARIWKEKSNGISSVGSAFLYDKDFKNNIELLKNFTLRILDSPDRATYVQICEEWRRAKDSGAFSRICNLVINRVFAAADPLNLTSVVAPDKADILVRILKNIFQLPADNAQNWFDLNRSVTRCLSTEIEADPNDCIKSNIAMWMLYEHYDELQQERSNRESNQLAEQLPIAHKDNAMNSPLNQILFGPPGTGKTFSTINAALGILDPEFLAVHSGERDKLKYRFDELVKNQHIRFVTFHQSFSYEDFVEGLSAETENGQIRYDVKSGVFMQLCEAAVAKVVKQESVNLDVSKRRVWKMSLGNTLGDDAYIFDECITDNKILLGYGRLIDFGGCKNREEVFNKFVNAGRNDVTNDSYDVTSVTTFVTKMQVGDLVVISEGNYKFRAIGEITSDYLFSNREEQDDHYGQSRSVRWLRVYQPSLPYEQLLNRIFSQQTIYELKDHAIDREKLASLLGSLTESSDAAPNQTPRVLIIDEINRGNISKIFGELITLIEPSKRAGKKEALEVILPYSKKPFAVPSNVYIIGTMNTSDRSLAGLDIALRRRFVFKEMPPKYDDLRKIDVAGINIGDLLHVMNQRIEVLLGRDYCLGHAYFMSLTNESSIGDLAVIFQKQIFPLLQEYFFEDWQRIQWVLNDHNKTTDKFIERKEEGLIRELFGADLPIAETQLPWIINENAFFSVDAYQGILKVNV